MFFRVDVMAEVVICCDDIDDIVIYIRNSFSKFEASFDDIFNMVQIMGRFVFLVFRKDVFFDILF